MGRCHGCNTCYDDPRAHFNSFYGQLFDLTSFLDEIEHMTQAFKKSLTAFETKAAMKGDDGAIISQQFNGKEILDMMMDLYMGEYIKSFFCYLSKCTDLKEMPSLLYSLAVLKEQYTPLSLHVWRLGKMTWHG